MKETITELVSLCKMAAVFERKWDMAGQDYLETRMTSVEYTYVVEEYLGLVRRLEMALADHLLALTTNRLGMNGPEGEAR